MYYVDLNSDLGESFGNYTIGMDREILKYVSSANVACGWHAGDPMVMAETVAMAREYKNSGGRASGLSRPYGLWPPEHERDAGGGEGLCEIPAGSSHGLYRGAWE